MHGSAENQPLETRIAHATVDPCFLEPTSIAKAPLELLWQSLMAFPVLGKLETKEMNVR